MVPTESGKVWKKFGHVPTWKNVEKNYFGLLVSGQRKKISRLIFRHTFFIIFYSRHNFALSC